MSLVLQFATRPRRIYMAACTLLAQSVIGPCRVHRRPALPQVSFLGWQSLLSLGRNYPSRTGLARAFVRPTNEMSSDDLSAACARMASTRMPAVLLSMRPTRHVGAAQSSEGARDVSLDHRLTKRHGRRSSGKARNKVA